VGPRAGLGAVVKRKIPRPLKGIEPRSSDRPARRTNEFWEKIIVTWDMISGQHGACSRVGIRLVAKTWRNEVPLCADALSRCKIQPPLHKSVFFFFRILLLNFVKTSMQNCCFTFHNPILSSF
jgi:hypothetical protein